MYWACLSVCAISRRVPQLTIFDSQFFVKFLITVAWSLAFSHFWNLHCAGVLLVRVETSHLIALDTGIALGSTSFSPCSGSTRSLKVFIWLSGQSGALAVRHCRWLRYSFDPQIISPSWLGSVLLLAWLCPLVDFSLRCTLTLLSSYLLHSSTVPAMITYVTFVSLKLACTPRSVHPGGSTNLMSRVQFVPLDKIIFTPNCGTWRLWLKIQPPPISKTV